MCPVQLSVDVEATIKFALENLSLDATTMAEYEKENGIATKGGLNMLYHVFKVSQLPVFRDSLDVKKTCSVAAAGTSSNTGYMRGFFQLLQQWVTRLRLDTAWQRLMAWISRVIEKQAYKNSRFVHGPLVSCPQFSVLSSLNALLLQSSDGIWCILRDMAVSESEVCAGGTVGCRVE